VTAKLSIRTAVQRFLATAARNNSPTITSLCLSVTLISARKLKILYFWLHVIIGETLVTYQNSAFETVYRVR